MGVRRYVRIAACVGVVAVVGVGAAAAARDNSRSVKERLTGYEEVPAISTSGSGSFRAFINRSDDEINYRVTFSGLETAITQSHIHFENETNNGPIVAFLCTNLGNGPAGTQACPGPNATSGTIEGTIEPADVLNAITPAGDQGLHAGEFDEFVRAIRAGATYVNIHTTDHPGGEIRAQLEDD
jgi:CHRD domain